ncbi:MAG: hypothetical protein ACKODX_10070 [Gemmata sp.]
MRDDFFDDLDRLRLTPRGNPLPTRAPADSSPKQLQSRRVRGEFLKGPVPLVWLTAAAQLSGKSPLAVGLALWFEAGRRRSPTVTLTSAILARFGVVDRKSKYRGIVALEQAGLINVIRVPRRNPVVTILNARNSPHDGGGINNNN